MRGAFNSGYHIQYVSGAIAITLVIGVLASQFLFVNQSASRGGEEYDVFSTLINGELDKSRAQLIVIQDTTTTYNPDYVRDSSSGQRTQEMKERFASVEEGTLKDFDVKHTQPYPVEPLFQLAVVYRLISEKEVDEYSREAITNMKSFYKKYPGARGVIRLSKVGFNAEKTQAFVYVENILCPLCESGEYILMSKEGNAWTIRERYSGWGS